MNTMFVRYVCMHCHNCTSALVHISRTSCSYGSALTCMPSVHTCPHPAHTCWHPPWTEAKESNARSQLKKLKAHTTHQALLSSGSGPIPFLEEAETFL